MDHARPAAPTVLRRPMIKTGLRRLRRGRGAVQFGTDPDRAVVLGGLDVPALRWLDRLDGLCDVAGLRAAATEVGLPVDGAEALFDLLVGADLVEDAATRCPGLAELPLLDRDRLAPDLASLALVHPGPDGGKRAFAARAAASVQVRGGGRVGAAVAGLLAAAGIGTVQVHDQAPTRPGDLGPAGLGPDDLGVPRGVAATRRIAGPAATARAPQQAGRAGGAADEADLVVLTGEAPASEATGEDLLAAGIPHLVALVRETSGVVGPLVLPGRSSCLRCHHLLRADRDPDWPRLAAQLADEPPAGATGRVRACDTVLASAVACHAALQVLAYLECGHADTVDGTLHLTLPDGRLQRRSWRRHPACGCGWGDPA